MAILAVGWLQACSSEVAKELDAAAALRAGLIERVGSDAELPVRLVDFGHRPPARFDSAIAARSLPRVTLGSFWTPRAEERLRLNLSSRAEALHAKGLAELFRAKRVSRLDRRAVVRTDDVNGEELRSISSAVELFRKAADQQPYVFRYQNDLAAALYLRSLRSDRLEDMLAGLDAAVAASELIPRSPEPSLTQALILQRLGLRARAVRAFEDARSSTRDSDWSSWIAARVYDLERDQDRSVGPASLTACSRAEIEVIPDANDSQALREFVLERLAPSWARASLQGDRSQVDALLACWRSIASDMGRDGDLSVVRGLEETLEVADGSTDVVESWQVLGDGVRLYREGRYREAGAVLQRAVSRDPPEGVLSDWVESWLIGVEINDGSFDRAEQRLQSLGARIEPGALPALLGRVAWAAGLLRMRRGRPYLAGPYFDLAASSFARAGEARNVGAIRGLQAESSALLGEADAAARYRLEALRVLGSDTRSQWLHNVLLGVANTAQREGLPRAGGLLAGACLDNAYAAQRPDRIVEAATWKARLLIATGRPSEARQSLEVVRQHLPAVGDPGLVRRLTSELELVTASAMVERQPSQAVAMASETLSFFRASSLDLRVPAGYLVRAAGWGRLGRPQRQEADLRRAVELLEQRLENEGTRHERAAALETVQQAYEELAWSLANRGRDVESLAISERSRSIAAEGEAERSLDGPGMTAVLRSLPSQTAFIEFLLTEQRILAWTYHQGRLDMSEAPLRRAELRRRIGEFVAGLREGGRVAEVRSAGERIFEQTLSGPLENVPVGTPLVLIVDRTLFELPWAALPNPRTGRLVLQDHPLALSRGLGEIAERAVPTRARREEGAGPPDVVLIGNTLSGEDSPFVPLPYAGIEARRISRFYDHPVLLIGESVSGESILRHLSGARIFHYAGHFVSGPFLRHGFVPLPGALGEQQSVLRPAEIAQLELSALDLVVLSACRSAYPADTRAYGVGGMAGAFLDAGAAHVLASLWAVEDGTTAAFMDRFHGLLSSGLGARESLRQVQLQGIEDHPANPWRDARVWAGFQLYSSSVGGPPVR